MTGREAVIRTIRFEGADRLPYDFPERFGSDFVMVGMDPSPDMRPANGKDEWGAVWANIGNCILGEVKEYPLKSWDDFGKIQIPDVLEFRRWQHLEGIRQRHPDKFILAQGISIYERVHFIRGLENTWMDIYDEAENLEKLLDILVEMNLAAIEKYSSLGADGYLFADDWGLQDRMMISPNMWRKLWKPRYTRIFKAAHQAGLNTFLHSCGYIVDILEDLIEAGLDAIHMDQQENMTLELLGERFAGRLTFFSPVDIQKTMVNGSLDDIKAYCRKMVKYLYRNGGGFIPRWYTDPVGAGHRQEALDAMCEEFLKINREMSGC